MYIGIDLGTSGVKAILLNEQGEVVASHTEKLTVSRPHPLWSEQDPEQWWLATDTAMKALGAQHSLRDVKALGIAGQMHGATLLDKSLQVLRPAILWNDGRCAEECQLLEDKVSASRQITGNLMMPGFTAPKLLWVQRHEAAVFSQVDKVLLPKDYLRLRMTGELASDMSDAAGTMWLDVARRDWSDEMLAACDLSRDAMPALFEGSDVTGQLRPEVAQAWNMPPALVVGGGGDNAAGALAARYRPHTREHFTMSPPANDGAALHLAAALNAREGTDRASNFFWAPVSVLTRADGSEERFPHLVTDRAKPGVIAVNQRAVRFVNESSSYHHFASAMQDAAENAPCFLLCDAQAMKRYGLGLARPAPVNNDALVAAGYLHKADTLAALAQQLGLDAQTLSKTVARYNRDAAQGVDREFAKGGNSYNRAMGDPGHQPDACNAPLLSAPFYAIKLYTGDLGTSRGLVTTADAQVVNTEGHPIPGLYAVGNDMDSLMAGTYPGPGITLGPGLTFGYLAACHLAQHSTH
ncbi:FGGY family carbohydrate kinase [Klebsiella pneumoniae]